MRELVSYIAEIAVLSIFVETLRVLWGKSVICIGHKLLILHVKTLPASRFFGISLNQNFLISFRTFVLFTYDETRIRLQIFIYLFNELVFNDLRRYNELVCT